MSLTSSFPSTPSLTSSSSHSASSRRPSSSSHSVSSPRPSSGSAAAERMSLEQSCLSKLRAAVKEDASLHLYVNPTIIYRYAALHEFDYFSAMAALRQNCRQRYNHLSLSNNLQLLTQLQTQTLFPLPGLKTNQNCSVVYMMPCRYTPVDGFAGNGSARNIMRRNSTGTSNHNNTTASSSPHQPIIDNLCYVLNQLSQTEEDCRNGVALVANMKDWTMKNFSQDYCLQFMQALQGKMVPTKVELFLIVNPPKWFGKIFKIMKPMLSKSFAKKTHIIKDSQLGDYLMEGFERYLPDEFPMGLAHTDEILEDFIDLKLYEDEQKALTSLIGNNGTSEQQ